jgi:hypothetical protein
VGSAASGRLERFRRRFQQAGGDEVNLADALIAEQRRAAAAEDGSIGR